MTSENVKKIESLLKDVLNAQETLLQLRAGGVSILMSWGARDYVNFQGKGLLFKVSGFKHKGYVLITLDYNDTYTVYLLDYKCEIKETLEMVYCDELTDRIDSYVEKTDNYEATVKKEYGWK